MRPLTLRIARAIAAALLLLALSANVAYADDPAPQTTEIIPAAPADPGYPDPMAAPAGTESVPVDPGYGDGS